MKSLISSFPCKNYPLDFEEFLWALGDTVSADAIRENFEKRRAFADRSNFKLYLGDTGLLVTQYMRSDDYSAGDLYKALIFNKLSINQGMLFENVVAQMLRSSGHQLYFHEFRHGGDEANEKKYEIDFLIVKKRKLCPIEVKSSNYKAHKSLDTFIEKYRLKAEDRYVIYTKNYLQQGNMYYIPLYMAWLL